MPDKVLIAVDGSKGSDMALKWYVDCAHRPDRDIILISVANPELDPNYSAKTGLAITSELWNAMLQDLTDKVNVVRDKHVNMLKNHGVTSVTFVHKTGNAGEQIVKLAQDEKCEMVVVGSRGLGMVRRTVLGSVSDFVLHHSHIPVVICKA